MDRSRKTSKKSTSIVMKLIRARKFHVSSFPISTQRHTGDNGLQKHL